MVREKNNVFIFKPFSEGVKYGIGSYINALIKQKQDNYAIYVVELFFPDCKHLEYFQNETHGVIKIPFFKKFNIINGCLVDAQTCVSIWSIILPYIDTKQKNVFHFQTPFLLNLIKQILRTKEHKVIYTVHKLRWKYYFNCSFKTFKYLMSLNLDNPYHNFVKLTLNEEKKICNLSHKVIVLTHQVEDYVSREYGIATNKIFLVRNGIKVAGHNEFFDKPIDNRKEFNFLFVGRICEEKGVSYLLKAFDKLANEISNIKLFIAGDGELPDIKLKNKSKIVLLGHINRKELNILYKKADVGLIPSLNEECSYVALEMANNKIPIICSNLGGLKEMFEHQVNALKIKFYYDRKRIVRLNGNSLKQNMQIFYNDKTLREKLAENAYLNLKNYYDINLMRNKVMDLYRNI